MYQAINTPFNISNMTVLQFSLSASFTFFTIHRLIRNHKYKFKWQIKVTHSYLGVQKSRGHVFPGRQSCVCWRLIFLGTRMEFGLCHPSGA
jgi:hypothetical protein